MMTLAFFGAAFCLLLAVHPFATYPLSLLLLKRLLGAREVKASPTAPTPTFSLCMCAYNEERVIEAKIANLLELKACEPELSIHIYVDGASDRTAELLRRHATDFDLVISPVRHGKTHGMNLLSARAPGSILVFTDANVIVDTKCIEKLRRYFADTSVGCVCGNLIYTNPEASVTAASGSMYWRLEEWIKRREGEVGSVMGADGSLFAIRRELRVDPPDHIIDDMFVSLMVLCEGMRIVQADDVRAYEASATSGSDEFRRKVRIACQAFNVHRIIWPGLRELGVFTRYQYLSHKYLRWLCIYFLGAAGLLLEFGLIAGGHYWLGATLLGAAVIVVLLGAKTSIKPFAQIVDLLGALAGAGLGVLSSLRGERYQTWTPAASIRTARVEQ